MNTVFKQPPKNSRLILEELEPRRLFSGGIEGLVPNGPEYLTDPLIRDLDSHRALKAADTDNNATAQAEQQSHEIVFVDAGVDNFQQFVDDLEANQDTNRNIEVVVLDRDRDGIEQISAVLQDRDSIDAVHIISHGSDGSVQLGNSSLNADTLAQNNSGIALWANAFNESGDILIYGCDLAASEVGQNLITKLANLTLTDVAASNDVTGHESLGGDWDLEYHAGEIDAEVAPGAGLQARYQHILAVINGTAGDDVLNGTVNDDIISADAGNDVLVGGGGSDQMLGEAGNDVFRFTGAQNGDVYTVDGGSETDTIDLTGYSIGDVVFADGKVTIDLGGGLSFEINYSNIESVQFADVTATVLTGDTSATSFSGSATYIEGDAAFTVDHAGGGTNDWSYVAATNSLSISDTDSTSAASAITITSHEGSNFSIDSIASDGVVGSLTTNVDISQITFTGDNNRFDIITISNGAGTLGSITYFGDMATASTITIDANVGTFALGPGRDIDSGTFLITGDVRTVDVPNFVAGTVIAERVIGQFDSIADSPYSNNFATPTMVTLDGTTSTEPAPSDVPYAYNNTVAVDENTANTTSVTTVSATGATEGDYAEMYWADKVDGAIYKANADGTGGTTTVLSGIDAPVGLKVDYNGGKLYWTTNVAGNASLIQSANLDGSGLATLVSGLTDPDGIALDLANGKMYWNDDSNGEISRANLDGSAVELLISSLTNPESIALDVDGGKMYWTDHGTNKIQRANLDGTGIEDLVISGLSAIGDIELDLVNGKMYWTNDGSNKIQRANFDGSGVEDLVTGLSETYYLDLDVSAGKVYWTDTGTNKIQRANFDGSGIEDLVTTGTDDPRDVALSAPATLSGPLSFSITAGNTGNAFGIDANTGEITVADSNVLDFETTPVFSLTVEVQDTVTLLTDTAIITINLNDVDESLTAVDDAYSVSEDATLNSDSGWFDSNWLYSRTLSFDNSTRSENLVDFPVLVKLDSSVIDYAKTHDQGDDLRFFDQDGSTLAHEIELWDESGTSYVWVKIPQIDASSSVDSIVMYYGNAGVTGNGQDPAGVWSDYQATYHLNENPGATGTVADAAGNFDATNASSTDTAGFIGNAQDFNGVDQHIDLGDDRAWINNASGATLSIWMNADTTSGSGDLIGLSRNDPADTGASRITLIRNGDDIQMIARTMDDSSDSVSVSTSSNPLTAGSWHHITGTVDYASDTNNIKIYVDGQLEGTFSHNFTLNAIPNTDSSHAVIGADEDGASAYFDGQLDEARIADQVRSADWISAQYAAMTGNLVSIGFEQTVKGVLINDVDADRDALTVTELNGVPAAIGVATGLPSGAIVTLNADGSFLYNTNGAFESLGAAETTTDSFTYLVDDGFGTNDIATVTMTINGVDDSASITGDSSYSGDEGDVVAGDLNATDVEGLADGSYFSVTTDADNGTATIDPVSGNWTFTPADPNWFGSDSFTVTVTDDKGGTTTQLVTISLASVNDAPVNTVPGAQTVGEDTSISITGISVNDVDGNLATTQLTVSNGNLTVDLTGGATISAGANDSNTLTLSGSQAQINAALASLAYQGDLNYNGSDTLTVLSTDSAGTPLSDSDTVAITVNPVNDAPVNTVPGAQTVSEDTSISITGISVNDVDGNLATTQLTVSSGNLNVDLTGGATITAGANDSNTLTLSGTQTEINAALATLSYQGNSNFNGSDSLTVLSTDSAGTPLSDSDSVAITVTAANDAPVNTVPGAQTVGEDTSISITGISVNDVDGNLATTLVSVSNGNLNVSLAGGATISAGANDSNTLTLSGSQAQINAALASLAYQGDLNYNGSDTLTVLSTDSAGTPLSDSDSVAITVSPVNDAPSDIQTISSTDGGLTINADGGNDTYLLADSGLAAPLSQFTFETQFEAGNLSNEVPFISYNTGSGDILAIQTRADNSLEIDIGGTTTFSTAIDYNALLTDGQRHTLSVTWDNTAGDWEVYVDGVLIDSGTGLSTGQTIPTGGTLLFGLEQDTLGGNFESQEYFNGTLYDIRLFDDVRTATEIDINKEATLAPSTTNLIANWQFDDLSTNGVVTDTVSGNNLTVQHTNQGGFSSSDPELTLAVDENTANNTVVGQVEAIDDDTGDTHTYAITGGNTNSAFAIDNNGVITIANSAALDFETNPTFTLTIEATDSGTGNLTGSSTVTISVNDVDEAAVVTGTTTGSVNEGNIGDSVTASGSISISDVDAGDSPSFADVGATNGDNNYGSFVLSSGTWTYTVNQNAVQDLDAGDSVNDTITYTATDGTTQQITVTINGTNDAPVNTVPGAQTVTEDTSLSITGISVNDVDGNLATTQVSVSNGNLNVSLAGGATISGGANDSNTLTLSGSQAQINAALASLAYQGDLNYNGSDTLTVLSTDSAGAPLSDSDTVAITVSPVNDAPVNTVPGAQTVGEDTSISITGISVNDVDGNLATTQVSVSNGNLNVSLAGGATISAGANDSNTLTLSGTQTEINAALATLSYQGNSNFNGSDTLTVLSTDSDGTPLSDSDNVAITVTQIDDAGSFGGDVSATTDEDTATSGTVTFADTADGFTTANFSLNTDATNGAATIDAAGNWTYTPTANYNGADSFVVQVTDDDGNVENQTINITVSQIDDAGTFGGDVSATTNEDTATSGTVTFADTADGFTTNNFALNTAATNGVAAIDSDGNWTYTPTANFNGADSFVVQVTDDDGNVETQTINITVSQIDDAGTFGGDVSATTNEDTATSGTVTFADTADGFTTNNFALNTAATNGVAAIDSDGNWTYTPTANFNGADSFVVQVTDDDGNVETQTINITVSQIDDAGTFGGDVSATTNEDTATSGTVTFADTADGFTTPNFSLNTAASNGVAAIDPAGNWTYTPTANYNGADSFTVQVTDDDGHVETQVISLTVTAIDDVGTFGGDTAATTNEDTATAGTVTFTDAADGFSTANFSINTAASNGVAAIDAAGNWTYTPTANFNGADSFTVQVTDDDGHVETQVISITITPINDAGTFGGDTAATTNEDTATAGTVTFADSVDGFTTPNFSLAVAATNGVATINAAGNWTYNPTANFNGSDSFTVQVTDDDGHVETQVISITVTAIDDAGTFGGDTAATTNEDTATAGTVTFADSVDGFTTPNFSLATAASNGVAAIDAAGNWAYTPTANYNGADSFTVQVTDDDGHVETQVISITVTAVNDAGTFGGDVSATTNEDTATSGTVTFADTADGFTTNNFALNTAATNGVAAIDSDGNWTYTPTANFNGADSFVVQVTDDDGNVETQTINITVSQIDDAGTFSGDVSATTNEDTATTGTVTFADTADGFSSANFSLNTAASNGVAAIDPAGNWTYTPTANYNGADSFTVQVTDDDGNVETQVISITVTQIDDTGTFGGDTSATTNEDTATAGTVTFADAADGFSTPNFSINAAASNGVAAIDAAGNWTYTPTANYNGADSFTVQVTDDDGNVETQVISITVTQIDDAGTFGGDVSATTNEDTPTSGTVTFADAVDGFTTNNFALTSGASNGTAAIDSDGNWTYTPTANYNGADSFVVQVTDDDGNVETQVISITVTAIDDAGSFGGDVSATTDEDTGTSGTVTFTDPADGFSTPNFSINAAASNGVAAIDAAGNWTYTPGANYNGTDSFVVQVTDDDGHVETQVISLTITPIDDAGTFGGDTAATTNEDTATAGTVTFVDTADGFTTPNFSLNTAASNGVAAIDAAGNWTYTPSPNYNGADSFTVQVTDDDGHVETQVISLTVTPINDAGTFGGNTSATTNEDTATAGTVTFTDTADGFTTANFSINTAASNGVAAIDAAGNWAYTPSSNYNGADSFTVQVTDDDGHVETQVISLTVTPINDAGTFGGDTAATTNEDTATAGTVTFTDAADGFTTPNFSLATAASNGVAAIDAAGNWTYTPTANYNGADSFTVQVTDDDGNVETQVISITVTQIDDTGTFGGNTSATTNEDTATAGTVTFTDAADGFTTPNFSLNTAASNGVATIDAAGNWTYTPTANYNGADSFTVQVIDDDGNVETQVISLTVTQIDDTGTFGGDISATTNEDTATAGTVTFSDTADGFSTPNFSLTTSASNGVAAIDAAGNWTYTPTANYNGADSFTVQVTDDDGNVETQVISITVTQIDDTGTFGGNTSATTNEDTATAGTVTFTDAADGFSTPNFSINAAASNGVAAIDAAGNWTYTPTANYNGADSFTVQVTDDDGNVETQVISLTVTQIDDTGTFGGNTSATTNENTATAGTVTFADTADGFTTPNFSLNTAASNGVAAIDAAGNWTYTPTANYNGADSFTVQVTDDDGNVETQVISLTVTSINNPGTFGGDTAATTNEDTATAGTVTFADALDGFSTPNFSLNTAASNGVAAIDAAGNWTYTPTANYNGADSFTVQVTDDDGNVETQVISLTVTAVNDAGVIAGVDTGSVQEDVGVINNNISTSGLLTIADPDVGESNFIAATVSGTHGVLTIDAAGNWSYSADNNSPAIQSLRSGETLVETLTVTTADGNTHDIIIRINGAEEPEPDTNPADQPPPTDDDPPPDTTDTKTDDTGVDDVQTILGVGEVEDIYTIPQSRQATSRDLEGEDHSALIDIDYLGEAVNNQRMQDLAQPREVSVVDTIIDNLSFQATDDEAINERYENALLQQLDLMRAGMDNDVDNRNANSIKVQIVMGTSTTLTAGIVSWVLRGGSLLASLMSTVPLLRRFDPLPIVKSRSDEDDLDPDDIDGTDITGSVSANNRRVDNLFSRNTADRQPGGRVNE